MQSPSSSPWIAGSGTALPERSELVVAIARILYVNGQATEEIVAAAARVGDMLGLRATLLPRWGELLLLSEEDGGGRLATQVAANPTGVDMGRVASTMQAIDKLGTSRLAPESLPEVISAIAQAPSAPTWLFTLAAAAGAVSLAVLFGIRHLPAAALVALSAAAGALLRRSLAQFSSNVFVQPFCAALLAGLIGALAERYELSSSLRLVAVCPCMVLVPGPHVLNGALDLVNGRIHLGATRLLYAGLVVVAISTGLLLGLALLGVALPIDPVGRGVPLWEDIVAAGVAVASYSVFFSTPLRMFGWPVAVGVSAHAFRWVALNSVGAGPAMGACVFRRRAGPDAGGAEPAHAFRRDRFRLRGLDDSGRFPLPYGQRPCAAYERLANNTGAHRGHRRRWHDRRRGHSGNEPWADHPKAGDGSLQRPGSHP
jgi:uncharacterized membrane protein YjjP (DUF1212 family)